jgi:hypothetical protein
MDSQTLHMRQMPASWRTTAWQSSVPILGAEFGFQAHDGGVRLWSDASQSIRALNRPRADHNEAHAVVSSSTEPEAKDVRQIRHAMHRTMRVATVNQIFEGPAAGGKALPENTAVSTQTDTQRIHWLVRGSMI